MNGTTLIPLRPAPVPLGSPTIRSPEPAVLPHFVVGVENRLAGFVCQSDDSIVSRGNPLLIIGPGGTGKTTVARFLLESEAIRFGTLSTIAEPALDFARLYADAVDADSMTTFRERYKNASVVLFDDLHLISGKVAAQDELSALLRHRVDNDLPTIVTCRRLPTDVDGIRPQLASRLLPGLTIPLRPPGPIARQRIIADYATRREVSLTVHQITLLERHLPADISTPMLCASVQQLVVACRAADASTISDDAVLSITTEVTAQAEPSLPAIAKVVARRYKLKLADMKSASRRKQVVRARSMAMYLGRQLTGESLQAIGRYFGGRDHTTVIHAIRSTENYLATDPAFVRVAQDVSEKLGSPRAIVVDNL